LIACQNPEKPMARRSDHTREELHGMILDAAREIVDRQGLARLTTRRVADAIGYSSGTLYNLFKDLDDIVVHLNARTLDALFDEFAAVPRSDDVEATLGAFADRYIDFVAERPRLWGLLFQNLPNQSPRPQWYYARMDRLFDLVHEALDPVFEPGEEREKHDAARVLWSGLHGMCSLATEQVILSWDEVRRLSKVMIALCLAGRRPTRARAQ